MPSAALTSGEITEVRPDGVLNFDPALKLTPGKNAALLPASLTSSLQYWMASCAMPT